MDVLLSLADAGMFEPLWSDAVLMEAHEALLGIRPQASQQINSYIGAIKRSYPYACVPADEFAIDVPILPDPNDRHVLAAAVGGGARWVVTYNLKDFPAKALIPLGIEPISPDSFLCLLLERNQGLVISVMEKLVGDKKRPSRTMKEELTGLRRNGLVHFADRLQHTKLL